MTTWLTPTIMNDNGIAVVTNPDEIAGRVVVGRIDADECDREPPGPHGRCGLVRGHAGSHWLCAEELIDKGGPFALIRSVIEDVEE